MHTTVEPDHSDFEPLATHPLGKRWLSEQGVPTTSLPPDQIQPLAGSHAAQLWQSVRPLLNADRTGLDPSRFRTIIPFTAIGDPAGIRQTLSDFLPREASDLLLAWAPFLAAMTHVDAFVEHWDAICRSGDDLVVWPSSDRWTAFYRRDDERLFLGTRNATT